MSDEEHNVDERLRLLGARLARLEAADAKRAAAHVRDWADRPKIVDFFAYAHLPAYLQRASAPFYDLAHEALAALPPSAERSAGLRKLLEAKDCMVRAHLAAHHDDADAQLGRKTS